MTLTDLYRKALEKLEIVAAGESAAPEDTSVIASQYVLLWNQLKVRGLVSWTVTEDVPAEAVIALVFALAYLAADEFGDDSNRFAAAGAIGLPQVSLAERDLRQLHSRSYVSDPAPTESY